MTEYWKDRFYWPSVYWNEIACHAHEKMLVTFNGNGEHQLHSYNRATGDLYQITNEPGGKVFGCISSAGKWILYLDDKDGSETGHYVRVPFEGGSKENISPNMPNYSSFFIRTNANDSVFVWTAAMGEKHALYYTKEIDNQLEEPIPIYESANYIDTPVVSPFGRYICFDEETVKSGHTHHIWHVFDIECQKLFQVQVPGYPNLQPVSFLGSNETSVIATYSNQEYKQVVTIDILTGQVTELIGQQIIGDMTPLFYHEQKHQLLIAREYHAKQELYVYNFADKVLGNNLLPSGTFLSWINAAHITNDNKVCLQWENAGTPACLAYLPITAHSLQPTTFFPINHQHADAHWQEVHFDSGSGHRIQAWLMTPKNKEYPIPFVISAHGGPHSVAMDVFNPEALMWLDAGFGFLAVNYSGSTSFGEAFKTSIRGQPGKLEALDMLAARDYLAKEGFTNMDQVILTGWSWGGYVTLFTIGTQASPWAAAIAGIPVADTIASYEDETASLQSLDRELFGGSPKEVRKVYEDASPISHVENIKTPSLIIHAKNDSRCPTRQIENFIEAMQKANKHIESHWFNSGHLGHFSDPNIAVNNFTAALEFAKKHLNQKNK